MKTGSGVVCVVLLAGGIVHAQTVTEAARTLAATLEVYAFPKQGQTADKQSQDEAACYEWAVGTTGHDPFELRKKSDEAEKQARNDAEDVAQVPRGAGARGALAGAAAGAVIGEIVSDNAGGGAAVGAATGAIAARRNARRQAQEAEAAVAARSEQQERQTAGQMEQFRKAFSVCLEARDYLVRY